LTDELKRKKAADLGALEFAYIGDCVYELFVREAVIACGTRKVSALHKVVTSYVCAPAQADAAKAIFEMLNENEKAIFIRARNAGHHSVPKGCTISQYSRATALEAVLGYLYLCGESERLQELCEFCMSHNQESKGKTN